MIAEKRLRTRDRGKCRSLLGKGRGGGVAAENEEKLRMGGERRGMFHFVRCDAGVRVDAFEAIRRVWLVAAIPPLRGSKRRCLSGRDDSQSHDGLVCGLRALVRIDLSG
jgi:hypothetical protein